jgi:hypothetical protein
VSDFLRGEDDEVASFFAFQDIIIAVLGIIILIALQLSFSMNQVRGESGKEVDNSDEFLIEESEFIEIKKQRIELEESLRELRNKNLQRMETALKYNSSGVGLETMNDKIKILEFELIELKNELEELEKRISDREIYLLTQVQKLGLNGVQKGISKLTKQIETKHEELFELRKELEEADLKLKRSLELLDIERKQKDSLWKIPEKSTDGKSPLIITLDVESMIFEELNKPESLRVFDSRSLTSSFLEGIRSYSSKYFKIVFLFKPSGTIFFEEIIQLAKGNGFDVGYDPIAESSTFFFSLAE